MPRLLRALLVTGLLLVSSLLLVWAFAPDPRAELALSRSTATTAYYDRNGTLLYEALDPQHGKSGFVPLAELPPYLLHATIAVEDASFYSNPGIDVIAILRAAAQNWRSEGIVSGGSTLTQQLARNLWMTAEERGEQTLWRKLRESVLALQLGMRLGKAEILESYLNSAPYGHQSIGVEAAARVYFGKGARHLDLAECALLAGLPQAPSAYDPFVSQERAQARQKVVLSLMARQGYITRSEADAAAAEQLHFSSAAFPLRAPHFVAYVGEILSTELGLDPAALGGLRVYTTLDLGFQELAEADVARHVQALADKDVTNGALVALDPATGQLLAMVGSADYFSKEIDGEVNVALSPRQPGSSLKPFVYAAALEAGITPATVLFDVPSSFVTSDGKSYSPENYDHAWHGPVSVRDALANSYNVPAVQVVQRVGVGSFLGVAARAGLSTLLDKTGGDLSLALGSGEVRLLDLTAAYSALAIGGTGHAPVAILKVEDARGNVLYEGHPGEPRRVVSPQVAYLITSILSDNDARGPSFGSASPIRLSRPAAAKTGTTTDWRDNWTVGYTTDLAVGVWVGNADNRPMSEVSGISGAGPIWHDFMEEALKGGSERDFLRPSGLVEVEVCPESGQLPNPWCPDRRTELFVAGTEPRDRCGWHQLVKVDLSTGFRVGPDCPSDRGEERILQQLPPELREWGRQRGIAEPPADLCLSAGGDPSEKPSAPRLLLTSPPKGAVLLLSSQIPWKLQRIDLLADVSGTPPERVELKVDGTTIATFSSPPYRTNWQIRAGRHRFEAVATDHSGGVVASDVAEVVVEVEALSAVQPQP